MSTESQANQGGIPGQGSGTPEGTEQRPAGMTAEEFNKAFSAREKTLQAKFAKDQEAREAALEQRFAERLSALLEEKLGILKLKPPEPPSAAGKGAGEVAQGALKLDEIPEFLTLRKQAEAQAAELKRLQERQAAEQQKAAEATARERKLKLNTTAEGILAKHLAPGRAPHARAFLTHPDNNRIAYADDDSDDIVFINDEGDKVPLEKGLKTWLKGDDAKHYLPPQNPGGSGGGPGALGNGANNSPFADIDRMLLEHARGR